MLYAKIRLKTSQTFRLFSSNSAPADDILGVAAYGAVLLVVKGLKARDFEIIPGLGPRLANLLSSLGLIGK